MKILLYGFGPYGDFADNITEQILSEFPTLPEVTTKVFDVRFDRTMFEGAIEATTPDIILGLGQHPTSETIRIERVARNSMAERGDSPLPIDETSPETMIMSLSLPLNETAVETVDAGTYVCNYSMWIAENYARKHLAKAAFLHIPRSIDVSAARQNLIDLVSSLLASPDMSA